ncbi:MAG: 16S rRNA (cytosine(967)-C(5))-methyltransferase RsmB [Clostridia bacterium]|nr:16S rRNA (cytosine(967)-C(5))-methyltransferase RsmB [Clostridia bacterium]
MATARDCAFDVLQKMERDGAYSTVALRSYFSRTELSPQDIQLATALVFGVTERKLTLDYFLAKHLSQPIKKLKPQVLTILRIGAYQLLFMDKIPASAAVNEAVKSVKKNGCAFAAGLVNAVLRKVAAAGVTYPQTDNPVYDCSIRYSCPEWLVSHFITAYGMQSAEQILSASQGENHLYIRVNTLKTTTDALRSVLQNDGIETVCVEDLPNALILKNVGDITRLQAFADGLFFVQDYSSQLCCEMLDAQEGDFLVDCCAAPGGKSFTSCCKMNNRGKVLSCDLHPFKTDMISENAKRLGLTCLQTVCSDAVYLKNTVKNADRVLCDVPCSGLGVIGRKPEIRYKDKTEIDLLPALQLKILTSCSEMVKSGGILVYSTCTLNPAENEDVCSAFLQNNPSFEAVGNFLTVIPDGTKDGFFVAKMRKKAEEAPC